MSPWHEPGRHQQNATHQDRGGNNEADEPGLRMVGRSPVVHTINTFRRPHH
jgi:hypothetical protein